MTALQAMGSVLGLAPATSSGQTTPNQLPNASALAQAGGGIASNLLSGVSGLFGGGNSGFNAAGTTFNGSPITWS
jgi:hypothetical protein